MTAIANESYADAIARSVDVDEEDVVGSFEESIATRVVTHDPQYAEIISATAAAHTPRGSSADLAAATEDRTIAPRPPTATPRNGWRFVLAVYAVVVVVLVAWVVVMRGR